MNQFKVVKHLPKDVEKLMCDELLDYEMNHNIQLKYEKFSLLGYKEDEIIGVINCYTAYEEIYVDDMWICSKHRGKGYGRDLLKKLEEKFKSKGFDNINLCTSRFQAPEFYEKCGFKLEFIRYNQKNPQLDKFFFCKKFDDSS